jgi:hypothetical protein
MLTDDERAAAKAHAQAAMDAASAELAGGAVDEAEWQRQFRVCAPSARLCPFERVQHKFEQSQLK